MKSCGEGMCHLMDQHEDTLIAERKLLALMYCDIDHKVVFSPIPRTIRACLFTDDNLEFLYAWSNCSKKQPLLNIGIHALISCRNSSPLRWISESGFIDTGLFFCSHSKPNCAFCILPNCLR